MSVFDHPELDHLESVHVVDDPECGLNAMTEVHCVALGAAAQRIA